MRVTVVGDTAVAAMLLRAGAGAENRIQSVAATLAEEITRDWERAIPTGPTGMTGSDPANFVELVQSPGKAGAAAVSSHFVILFLQFGTNKMSPRVDLFGSAAPHIDRWPAEAAKAAVGE